MGRMVIKNTEDIFKDIFFEVDSYIKQPMNLSLIVGGYDALIANLSSTNHMKDVFTRHSLNTTLNLAQLRFDTEYLVAYLLYYPYLFQTIDTEMINRKFSPNVLLILNILYDLGVGFTYYLPWIKHSSVLRSDSKGREHRYPDQKKRFWKERTSDLELNIFVKMANIPEVAVMEVIGKLQMLNMIDAFEIDSEMIDKLAHQSIDLYTKVVDLLGMWSVKWKLEDIAFKITRPEEYRKISRDLNEKQQVRQVRIDKAIISLEDILLENGVLSEITGRPKHLFSIFKKMTKTKMPIEEINDLLGVRIIVDTKEDCFNTLNILEQNWELMKEFYPEEEKPFRDWISSPKLNRYQSIHTTIKFDDKPLEVQIRTHNMHEIAEYGLASHWKYKGEYKSFSKEEDEEIFLMSIGEIRKSFEERQKSTL
jgi:GTP pyrophosphokinase